jgi:4-aminobutyrate aminotransferase-like enzyme
MIDAKKISDRHRSIFPPWTPLFYAEPLEIVSGSGRTVRDAEGREYLDLYGGVAVNSLGYDVSEVREALEAQIRTGILHTSTFFVNRPHVELAERIAELSGIPDPVVFFTSSGSEAVETALALATQYRRSQQVIALRHAYHGRTFGALAVTGIRSWQALGLSPLRVVHARAGRRYGEAQDDGDYVHSCVADLRELIATGTSERTAALILEPVQGVAGAMPLVPGQLAAYTELAREMDICVIVDEVQTGWGRTGRWWAHQWEDAAPDLLVFAKGVGNGLALGGVVGRREIMCCLPGPSVSTFGGNPLACAAGLATIDYIAGHDLPAHADRIGTWLLTRLRAAGRRVPAVRSVHGRGLIQGVELADPRTGEPSPPIARAVQEECRRRGVLVGVGGTYGNCVRLMPPLTITADEAARAADALTGSLPPGGSCAD